MKSIALFISVLTGIFLIYGTADFPDFGDPDSPVATHVSALYLEHALEDTAVPNVVTAVLADYRGYDTMFETTVVFAAAIACFYLLRRRRPEEEDKIRMYRHLPTGITLRIEKSDKSDRGTPFPDHSPEFERLDSIWVPQDTIIKTTTRLVCPFIQLFGLYVIAHGHHSPGGGFQGGVILGASLILLALSFNLRESLQRFSEKIGGLFSALGVVIYAGTGAICIFLDGYFLDYAALAYILGTDSVGARSLGILIVEVGVGIAVMAAMVWIYYNLSSVGKMDEGL